MLSKNEIISAVSKVLEQKDFSKQATETIKRAADKVLSRVQQDISEKVREKAESIILPCFNDVKFRLLNLLDTKEDLMVYPDGIKLIQNKNNRVNYVIEQPPQIRTISVGSNMVRLSFPYVIFCISFNQGKWDDQFCVFARSEPLTTIKDRFYHLELRNIDGYHVCLGEFINNSRLSLTEQVNNMISYFWQSTFDYFCTDDWEKLTTENPLDILSTARPFVGTLEDILGKASRGGIDKNLSVEIDKSLRNLGEIIKNDLITVDLVRESKEKIHTEVLNEIIKEIITQAYSELHEYFNDRH